MDLCPGEWSNAASSLVSAVLFESRPDACGILLSTDDQDVCSSSGTSDGVLKRSSGRGVQGRRVQPGTNRQDRISTARNQFRGWWMSYGTSMWELVQDAFQQ